MYQEIASPFLHLPSHISSCCNRRSGARYVLQTYSLYQKHKDHQPADLGSEWPKGLNYIFLLHHQQKQNRNVWYNCAAVYDANDGWGRNLLQHSVWKSHKKSHVQLEQYNFLRDISFDFQTPWSTFEVEYHQFTFSANLTNVFPLSGKRRQLITTAASDISKSRRKGGTKKGPPMVERTRSSSRRLLIMQ